jgi:DNA (cytosine-5)-methyltransferase 1
VGRIENPWGTRIAPKLGTVRGKKSGLTTLELCAGAGGQAIGFEKAGIDHVGLVEIDKNACATLRLNRPNWNVIEKDIKKLDGAAFVGVDIISGGLPCPPFSVAGKQLGNEDERNLFPAMIRLVDQIRPRTIMIENVRGILDGLFAQGQSEFD